MADAADRKARLKALREAAAAAGDVAEEQQQQQQAAEEPSAAEPQLKFRNYALTAEERIEHQKVEPAQVPEFEEVKVDVDAVLGEDPEEILVNVAPKKANWDLRRDIADKLTRLERRTQKAMIQLMQQEEQRRLEGGED